MWFDATIALWLYGGQLKEILLRMSGGQEIPVERLLDPDDILAARTAIAGLYMDQKVVDYIVDLIRATRDPGLVGLNDLKPLVAFGGSPRASIALAQAAHIDQVERFPFGGNVRPVLDWPGKVKDLGEVHEIAVPVQMLRRGMIERDDLPRRPQAARIPVIAVQDVMKRQH